MQRNETQETPTVAAWARWVKGPFRCFMGKSGHTENIEMTLSLEEDIAEQEILDGALEALAARLGLDPSKEDLFIALAVYRKRKRLQPDLVKGYFVQWRSANNQTAEVEQAKEVDINNAVGLSGHLPAAFHEFVARLAATRVENEVLGQSLVPGWTMDSLNGIMGEQLLYAWMSSMSSRLWCEHFTKSSPMIGPTDSSSWQPERWRGGGGVPKNVHDCRQKVCQKT